MVYNSPSNTETSEQNNMNNAPTTTSSHSTDVVKNHVPYTATIQSGIKIGQFPNPRSVVRSYSLGNNKEAQQFLSRGGQVIIRMRGLPYDASAKQVVSLT